MSSMYKRIALCLVLICSTLAGTTTVQATIPVADIADQLRQRLQVDSAPPNLWIGGVKLHSPALLSRFYFDREYQPAWLNSTGLLSMADTLLASVADAKNEGLYPQDYHYNKLTRLLSEARHAYTMPAVRWTDLELLLTDAWLTYGSHLLSGRLNPRQIDNQWAIQGRSRDLVETLTAAVKHATIGETLNTLKPSYTGYALLRKALAYYRGLAATGGWPTVSPGPTLRKGDRDPRVKQLRTRLRITGDLAEALVYTNAMSHRLDSLADTSLITHPDNNRIKVHSITASQNADDGDTLFDEVVFQAVRRFQKRHGLADDGIMGPATIAELNVPVSERIRQIELNLERWRWLPEDLGRRYIVVNITDFSMSVVEDGRQILSSRAIVGKSTRPTPVLSANMSYLVMSPRWYVPRSIAIKDKLPQLRKDPYALFHQGIHIYDASGQEIDPGTINWINVNANNFHYRLRQDPGPRNALGGIKFIFPNSYNVYLHDTPSTYLFNRNQRTYSSGCIRIFKPIELAEYLLKHDPRWPREAIISASKSRSQRRVNLPEQIPVYLLYWTAWVDEQGIIQFRNDIYKRDQRLARALTFHSEIRGINT